MARRRDTGSWFSALRRDAGIFAVVATILLFGNLLQPLAEARAAETGKAWIICTVFGAEKPTDASGDPLEAAAADDCPLCIAGHHCGSLTPPAGHAAVLPELALPAFAAPAVDGAELSGLSPPCHGSPTGIRAPPFAS